MPNSETGLTTAFVARQPIVAEDGALMGYELLFRGSADCREAGVVDGVAATAHVMAGALAQELTSLTGGVPGFINFERELLIDDFPTLLQPPEAFVIEVLESVPPDPEVLERLAALRAQGFRFALDDVSCPARVRAFAPHIAIVKIDWADLGPGGSGAVIAAATASNAPVVVECIETESDFAAARDLGCQYFQGYLLGRPATMERSVIPAVDIRLFELLAALGDPTSSPESLERLICQDVGLVHQVLRFAASAHAAQRRKAVTVRDAMLLLGRDGVRRLAALMLLSRMVVDSPPHLAAQALARGQFCEEIAGMMGSPGQAPALFLAGLLSTLDSLLGVPMERALAPLPLEPDVESALMTGEGAIGEALRLVAAYEEARWDAVGALSQGLGVPDDRLPPIYHAAVSEADQIAVAAA